MSSHSAKPTDRKVDVSGLGSEDLTDWTRLDAMDDEDIVFDKDSPPLPHDFGAHGVFRYGDRLATPEEIKEFLQAVKAYADRPRKKRER
jgi:hypothetical protein